MERLARRLLLLLFPGVLLAGGPEGASPAHGGGATRGGHAMKLSIRSPAFAHNASIPPRYTCDGEDVSPPLAWSGAGSEARSLVLIVDDPDAPDPAAPTTTWVHWVLYNLPPQSDGLPEAVTEGELPPGTLQGVNDWGRSGYGGPCPPVGRHRYFFKLYSLDTVLPDLGRPTKARLLEAMEGHVLDHAELVGTYQRQR